MTKRILMMLALLLVMLSGCKDETIEPMVDEEGCLLHLGLVTNHGGVDDDSYNQAVWSGILRFAEENDLKKHCYGYFQAMETNEYVPYLTELAEDEVDLIVAADYNFTDAIDRVSKMYPNQKFLLIDSESAQPNVASFTFKAEEGSYLAGVAAALKAKEMEKTTVGFIGGEKGALIGAFQAGFEQGVAFVDPQMTVLVNYVGDYYDQSLAMDLAISQYDAGAGVIYHAAGDAGLGIIAEAKGRMNVYVIGVDKDQYEEGMTESGLSVVLTSMIKRIEDASYETAQAVLNREFMAGHTEIGLKEGGVSLELSAERNLSSEQIEKIQAVQDKIINEEIVVSKEPLLNETVYEEEAE